MRTLFSRTKGLATFPGLTRVPAWVLAWVLASGLAGLLVLAPAGQARAAADLNGDWTFSFTTDDGSSFSDPASIQQNGNRFSGVVTYSDGGKQMTEPFEGTIDAAGNVEFSLNDQGQIVAHQGRLNPNGTITGTWSMEGGAQGGFSLTPGQSGSSYTTGSSDSNDSGGGAGSGGGSHDLNGDWTFAFVTEDGSSFSDPCYIRQVGDSFSGNVTYYDNGQEVLEPFEGTINPDGSVSFTLYDQGEPVYHQGRVSADGSTISGEWSYADGKGTFTITRGAPANSGGAPSGDASAYNLNGDWTFAFVTEDGATYSDPCVIQQNGGSFSGKVTYSDQGQQVEEPFEGTISSDGSVDFVLYDNGEPIQHWGRVSSDGNSIQGQWSFENGSGTFTITRN